MRLKAIFFLAGTALVLTQLPNVTAAQGKGGGKGQGGGQAQGKGHGGGQAKGKSQGKVARPASGVVSGKDRGAGGGNSNPGHAGEAPSEHGSAKGITSPGASGVAKGKGIAKGAARNFNRAVSRSSMPASLRRFVSSNRPQDVILAGAAAHAFARGHGDDFRIEDVGNRTRIANRNGDQLLFLDDQSARDLGRWRVGVLNDDVREGAPAFCRSGAGHPVWGREWCIDKGFGLGSYEDFGWGRTTDVGNILFAPQTYGNSLIGDALAGVLGNTSFNRLALHAITLGLLEPLVGRWVSEPTGPQLLMVNSGAYPVAEVVDVNRDNRADDLLVALRPWY
jgi:hypothetical protein